MHYADNKKSSKTEKSGQNGRGARWKELPLHKSGKISASKEIITASAYNPWTKTKMHNSLLM